MISAVASSHPSRPLEIFNRCSFRRLGGFHRRRLELRLLLHRERRRFRSGKCRAELSADAPVAFAIGACILNSVIFPDVASDEDGEKESLIDSIDARLAVMGIIAFIPYFNWLSWVFAWLDTGKVRYAVYAAVYLAPYLRSNLSISPEDSWLPIVSILLCIFHIQLEARIRDGDMPGFETLNKIAELLSPMRKPSSRTYKEREDFHKIPSPKERLKKEAKGRAASPHDETDKDDEDINGDSDQ